MILRRVARQLTSTVHSKQFRFTHSDNMGSFLGRIDVETPDFSVLHEAADHSYQVRKYPMSWAILTPMDKGADTSPPFRRLAAYIGVGSDALNDQHEKIAMTAPVLNEGNASAVNETAAEATTTGGGSTALTATTVQDNEVMMFLLPSKYNEKNEPPKPENEQVTLKKIGERIVAVKTFSGAVGFECDEVKSQRTALFESLQKDHLVASESKLDDIPFSLARYNPPWTPGMLRKNEIFLTLVGAGEDPKEFETRLAHLNKTEDS